MGLLDFLKKKSKEVKVSVSDNAVNISFKANFDNNYVKIADRKNRYELKDGENAVTDDGQAEKFEETLKQRVLNYDEGICPYCNLKLLKVPVRKVKCKNCGGYINVVGSYLYLEKKMLLTESDKENLDNARELFFKFKRQSKDLNLCGITKKDFIRFQKTLGPAYSKADIIWGLLNERVSKDPRVVMFMGKFLMEEGKDLDALRMFIEGCRLDIGDDFLAPGVVIWIEELLGKTGLKIEDMKEHYRSKNTWSKFLIEYANTLALIEENNKNKKKS